MPIRKDKKKQTNYQIGRNETISPDLKSVTFITDLNFSDEMLSLKTPSPNGSRKQSPQTNDGRRST